MDTQLGQADSAVYALISNSARELVPRAYGLRLNPETDTVCQRNRDTAMRVLNNNRFHYFVSKLDTPRSRSPSQTVAVFSGL